MNIEWGLLTQYLGGSCTDAEREQVQQWLDEAPEHQAVLRGAQRMIADADREVSPDRAAELLASLRRNISAAERPGPTPRSPVLRVVEGGRRPSVVFPSPARRRWWTDPLKVAAAVLLVAGAGVWLVLPRAESARETAGASFREVVADRGQRISVQLGDGSAAVLAPESRLRIPRDYGVQNRTVFLEGEGVFTVTHDAARPFAVYTAHGVAKDLGTRFVVREYDDDPSVEVVVVEGEVELRGRTSGGKQRAVLARRQLGRVGTDGDITVRSGVDLEYYTAWTEGRLVFRDTPLREAVTRIARWYDVDVRLASEAIGRRHLTAMVHDEPARDVLQMVAASLGLDLQVSASGRVYTLRVR